jgi:hypothetical protein
MFNCFIQCNVYNILMHHPLHYKLWRGCHSLANFRVPVLTYKVYPRPNEADTSAGMFAHFETATRMRVSASTTDSGSHGYSVTQISNNKRNYRLLCTTQISTFRRTDNSLALSAISCTFTARTLAIFRFPVQSRWL